MGSYGDAKDSYGLAVISAAIACAPARLLGSVDREFYATSRRERGYGVIAQRREFSALLKMLRAGLA
jgi:hypothetical protein